MEFMEKNFWKKYITEQWHGASILVKMYVYAIYIILDRVGLKD